MDENLILKQVVKKFGVSNFTINLPLQKIAYSYKKNFSYVKVNKKKYLSRSNKRY